MSRRISIFGASFASGPVWLPETTAYMTAIGVPADGTVYYPSTIYERTGLQLWQAVEAFGQAVIPSGLFNPNHFILLHIGGTASTHKINYCNPSDPNAVTWFGAWTFGPTGSKPNGINAVGVTNFTPSTSLTANSTHAGVYSRTNVQATMNDLSSIQAGAGGISGTTPVFHLYSKVGDGRIVVDMNSVDVANGGRAQAVLAAEASLGTHFASRTANNDLRAYRRGVQKAINTNTHSTALPSLPCVLGAGYLDGTGGGYQTYSTREQAFTTIGLGLTPAQVAAYDSAIEALQVALNRNV